MIATDRQREINKVYHESGCNVVAVSKKMNISITSVVKNLFYGARNGLYVSPDNYSHVAPAGWGSKKKTVQYNSDGEIVQVWDRVSPCDFHTEQFLAYLESRVPVLNCDIKPPETCDENLCLEWKLMDHHLGMHAWAKETGANYSIKEARFLIESAARKIFMQCGPVSRAIIILGGDNIHADNRSALTEKSHNHLDVDNRYEKSVDGIYESMVTAIDISLTKARETEVIVLSGNHDYHSAINLSRILKAHYRNISRVNVNTDPGKHKFSRWGSNFFMYSHGDTAPASRLAAYMMNYIINNDITGIKRKLVRKGHIHKQGKVFPPGLIEEDGVIIETFPTLAAPDAYAAEHAYSNTRATVAETWHKKYGQRSRMELGIEELMNEIQPV
jgi:hypothetical protein